MSFSVWLWSLRKEKVVGRATGIERPILAGSGCKMVEETGVSEVEKLLEKVGSRPLSAAP